MLHHRNNKPTLFEEWSVEESFLFIFVLFLEYLNLLPLKVLAFSISATLPTLTTDHHSQSSNAKNPKQPTTLSSEPSKAYREMQREEPWALPEKNVRMVDEQKLLEQRLQRLEQEISHSQASPNLRSSAGRVMEPLEI